VFGNGLQAQPHLSSNNAPTWDFQPNERISVSFSSFLFHYNYDFRFFFALQKGELSISFKWFKETENLDPYHFNAFLECVKNMIGLPGEYNAATIIEEKLWTPGACSWTDSEILELLFYKGIAHFVRNEMEEVLDSWVLVSLYYQPLFRLLVSPYQLRNSSVDVMSVAAVAAECNFHFFFFFIKDLEQTCGHYHWDEEIISSDKLRVWIHQEKSKEHQCSKRKKLVTRLYELMVGTVEPTKPYYAAHPLSCASIFSHFGSQSQLSSLKD